MTNVRIAPLGDADIDRLVALAAEIWHAHYPAIISAAQIEYMLGQRYSPAVVQAELKRRDLWWDQLLVENRMCGFASYFLTANAGEMKLDKLYVDPARQRLGLGGRMIDHLSERALAQRCTTLILAVNKRNERAIGAYRMHGFVEREAVRVDIGNGFVMDDFIMAKSLR